MSKKATQFRNKILLTLLVGVGAAASLILVSGVNTGDLRAAVSSCSQFDQDWRNQYIASCSALKQYLQSIKNLTDDIARLEREKPVGYELQIMRNRTDIRVFEALRDHEQYLQSVIEGYFRGCPQTSNASSAPQPPKCDTSTVKPQNTQKVNPGPSVNPRSATQECKLRVNSGVCQVLKNKIVQWYQCSRGKNTKTVRLRCGQKPNLDGFRAQCLSPGCVGDHAFNAATEGAQEFYVEEIKEGGM